MPSEFHSVLNLTVPPFVWDLSLLHHAVLLHRTIFSLSFNHLRYMGVSKHAHLKSNSGGKLLVTPQLESGK